MANYTLNAPVASAKADDWNALVSAYRNAASERNAAAPNDWNNAAQESEWEKLVDRAGKALSAVTAYPVTTLAQLAEKCALVKAEYPDASHLDGDDCEAIIADVQRIASPDAIGTTGENPALVAAFDQYCAAARVMRNDPEAHNSGEQDAPLYAAMDAADDTLAAEPARTVSGVIFKLRRVFAGTTAEVWSDLAVFDDRPPAFAEGLAMADLYPRMFWSAVEDLQRIEADQRGARLANGGAAWDAAFAAMEAAKLASDALDAVHENAAPDDQGAAYDAYDKALTSYVDAIWALIYMPAPDTAALRWKSEYLFGETADQGKDNNCYTAEATVAFMADVRRLLAEG